MFRTLQKPALVAGTLVNRLQRINMTRKTTIIALTAFLLTAAAVYAAQGLSMKCTAKPEKDPATGKLEKACDYEATVIFGGMMFSDQMTCYCQSCKQFVYLHWTRQGAPMPDGMKVTPKPEPMGEVWNAATGEVLAVYAYPKCKGPVLEIKKREDLKFCPVCNKSHFVVDKTKPELAVD